MVSNMVSISSHSNSNGALLFLPLCVYLVALGLNTHSSLSCFPFKFDLMYQFKEIMIQIGLYCVQRLKIIAFEYLLASTFVFQTVSSTDDNTRK